MTNRTAKKKFLAGPLRTKVISRFHSNINCPPDHEIGPPPGYRLQRLPSVIHSGPQIAWKAAIESPREYVLKPQREGGGNNLYEEDLVEKLTHASAEERKAYILMERIRPIPHLATVVSAGEALEGTCVSEIGRFGVYLADKSGELLNLDAGYLVRTKGHQVREGGVTAGFAYLNSLIAEDRTEAPK